LNYLPCSLGIVVVLSGFEGHNGDELVVDGVTFLPQVFYFYTENWKIFMQGSW
jgi:hypothetical protein